MVGWLSAIAGAKMMPAVPAAAATAPDAPVWPTRCRNLRRLIKAPSLPASRSRAGPHVIVTVKDQGRAFLGRGPHEAVTRAIDYLLHKSGGDRLSRATLH